MPTTSIVVRKRVAGLFLLTVVAFFLLAGRLAWLQLVKGEELRRRALEARMRDVPVEARRGTICDRQGRELAVSVSVESCYAFPPQVKNPKETAARLAPLLKMEEARLEALLTQQQAFVWLKRKLEPEVTREIKALKLPGIGFVEESRRFYTQDTLAAHVLGYVGIDNQGLGGVEYALEKELQGEKGRIVIEHDALGRAVPDALHYYIPPQQGHDVWLTLDQTVQYFVERELDKIEATYQPRYAVIIVMDPRTGEILGMGSRPNFDPAQYQDVPAEVRDRNPAVWYNYEPGSTFKIVTLSAALAERVVNENSRFFDPGYIKVADRWIRCWYDGGHGSQTLAEVVQNSCNPGFIQIALDVGRERFYKYVRAFGFGEPT
ncbi:MAG: stage V sporulation protein D, partial [Firmicutes bacterium]|nr:stage V sporulation protein D [Bacillota bacterium]